MGSWGTGLYQNDLAEDLKSIYVDYFREGYQNEEVYEKILASHQNEMEDEEDRIDFWLAMADVMWKYGRLTEEVKNNALKCIEEERSGERWKDAGEKTFQKRQKVLQQLEQQLNETMPPEKHIPKRRIYKNKWKIGDMYVMPIVKSYPRFPDMKAKYLLIIKVDDAKDWSEHIQPVVYIKYLEEEYQEGMDINSLQFSHPYDNGMRFILTGIAGRPHPKELTYVGNYGDMSTFQLPTQPDKGLNWNCIEQVKHLEDVCVSVYLMYLLGVDGKTISGTMEMTKEEYEEYVILKEKKRIEAERKEYEERKRKEYYICPWEDGDVYYFPLEESREKKEADKNYVGVVMIKMGLSEDYLTTNLWPLVILQYVEKDYTNVEEVLADNVFHMQEEYLPIAMMFKKNEGYPKNLRYLGRVDSLDDIGINRNRSWVNRWIDL